MHNNNATNPIRVLLIDDHLLFRAGLAELLQRRGIEVVASVSEGESGIKLAMQLLPDFILLDIRMPDINGLDILQRLQAVGSTIPVIMVTTSRDDKDIAQALRLGAKGYLLKDMEPDELVSALQRIKQGDIIVAPELTTTLARVLQNDANHPSDRHKLDTLTPRETEILCYIAEGCSNKVISRSLGITDGTVKLHVKSILRKLDIHSRVEAAVIAVEQGLARKRLKDQY